MVITGNNKKFNNLIDTLVTNMENNSITDYCHSECSNGTIIA